MSDVTDQFAYGRNTDPEPRLYAAFFQRWVDQGKRLDAAINLHNVESGEVPHLLCPLMEPARGRLAECQALHEQVMGQLRPAGYNVAKEPWATSYALFRLGGFLGRYYGALHMPYEANSQDKQRHLTIQETRQLGQGLAAAVIRFLDSPAAQPFLVSVTRAREAARDSADAVRRRSAIPGMRCSSSSRHGTRNVWNKNGHCGRKPQVNNAVTIESHHFPGSVKEKARWVQQFDGPWQASSSRLASWQWSTSNQHGHRHATAHLAKKRSHLQNRRRASWALETLSFCATLSDTAQGELVYFYKDDQLINDPENPAVTSSGGYAEFDYYPDAAGTATFQAKCTGYEDSNTVDVTAVAPGLQIYANGNWDNVKDRTITLLKGTQYTFRYKIDIGHADDTDWTGVVSVNNQESVAIAFNSDRSGDTLTATLGQTSETVTINVVTPSLARMQFVSGGGGSCYQIYDSSGNGLYAGYETYPSTIKNPGCFKQGRQDRRKCPVLAWHRPDLSDGCRCARRRQFRR